MRLLLSAFTFLFLFSCQNNKRIKQANTPKPQMSIIENHKKTIGLDNIAKKNVSTWNEYKSLQEFLQKFESISANEAINNAVELSHLVKIIKDSIRPKELLNSPFRARINVLHSEALRLKDMTLIPAITSKEVHNQVAKIIEAFSATSTKINAVFHQLEVKKEIDIDDTLLKESNN